MKDLGLSAEEFETLSVHNFVQARVFDGMAEAVERGDVTVNKTAAHYRGLANEMRDRARMFKEMSAAEEETQTQFERSELAPKRDDVTEPPTPA